MLRGGGILQPTHAQAPDSLIGPEAREALRERQA